MNRLQVNSPDGLHDSLAERLCFVWCLSKNEINEQFYVHHTPRVCVVLAQVNENAKICSSGSVSVWANSTI